MKVEVSKSIIKNVTKILKHTTLYCLGHTPLNGFPILYCTKWHPKLLRFLSYKATGFFNSLNFFEDHDIGEPVRQKK